MKEDLEAFINTIQARVTGDVTCVCSRALCPLSGAQSPCALYSEDLASFDSKTFDQRERVGNVKTHGMQSRMYWSLEERMRAEAMSKALGRPLFAGDGRLISRFNASIRL